jgi:hypothetical protein
VGFFGTDLGFDGVQPEVVLPRYFSGEECVTAKLIVIWCDDWQMVSYLRGLWTVLDCEQCDGCVFGSANDCVLGSANDCVSDETVLLLFVVLLEAVDIICMRNFSITYLEHCLITLVMSGLMSISSSAGATIGER